MPLLLQRRVEPGPVHPHAVLTGQLDRQVDGKAIGVVQPERDVAGQHRRIRWQRVREPTDHPLGPRQRDERFLQLDGASIERSGKGGLLPPDGTQDRVPSFPKDGIRIAHGIDDHRRGLDQERLPPAEQSAVTHRTAHDAPEHVAPPLVRRQHAIGDQERDRPRVVGDDLVAEALRLERVRVVSQQLAQPGQDGREQVRVVVGVDALDDRRQSLQAHAGVDTLEWEGDSPR